MKAELKRQNAHSVLRTYTILNMLSLLHHINNALKANYVMARDVDYVIQDDEVVIVDQFTGRVNEGACLF